MTGILHLTAGELAEVRAILKQCLPDGVSVRAFGSRAGAKPKPWSDLDHSLEASGPLPLSVLAALREAFSESALPWKIDLADYRTASAEFAAIINRDGVALL